jgi:hypothetical protein
MRIFYGYYKYTPNIPILYLWDNMRITNKRVGGGDYWWEKSIKNKPNQEKPLGMPNPTPTIPKGKTISGFHNAK